MHVQSIGFSYFAFKQDPRFKVITQSHELETAMNQLRVSRQLAFDYETDGLAWWRGKKPCGVAFSTKNTGDPHVSSFYIPFRHITGQSQLYPETVIAAQKELLENPAIEKIAHNAKFETHMSRVDGIKLKGSIIDTMIEARLWNEDQPAGLKDRLIIDLNDHDSKDHEHMLNTDYKRLAKRRGLGVKEYLNTFGYAELEIFLAGAYAARDTFGTWNLHQYYEERGVRSYYSRSPRGSNYRGIYDIEMKLVNVLAKMEEIGQPLDVEYLQKLHIHLQKEREKAEVAFFTHFKCEYFNLASDDQLREFLWTGLKLRWHQTTESGAPAVDFDVLSDLSKKVPELEHIARFKEVEKKASTYTLSLIEQADSLGVLHCDYQQVGTNSGRLSCRKPNLQNIASDDSTRAKENAGLDPESVKRAFIVHRTVKDPYFKLKAFRQFWDYSQIELRVLAEYTKDERLVKAYLEDKDIHDEVEKAVFGTCITYDENGKKIDGPNRRKAKCFHPDTEALTRTGWKKILDLSPKEEVIQATPGDSYKVNLDWVVPTEVFSKPNDEGYLVHLKNEGMDLRVTHDHRMLAWGSPNDGPERFKVVLPKDMAKQRGWANAGHLDGEKKVDEWLLRLAVATQADGSIVGLKGAIKLGFTKRRKIKRLQMLLDKSGIFYRNARDGNFWIPREPAAPILELLEGKSLPWWWLSLTETLREVVLDEVQHWDSCIRPNWKMVRYSSVDTQSLDVLQALAACTNRKTRLAVQREATATTQKAFNLTIRDKNNTRGGNLDISEEEYNGPIACISVPSTFVLVRDGISKVPVIVGQTINFGLCIAEDEKVLTNEGLIPIQEVKLHHLLWDGVYWVSHSGLVCRGVEEVITYDGLTATPDHKIYTEAGDKINLWEALIRRDKLAIGEINGFPVRYGSLPMDSLSIDLPKHLNGYKTKVYDLLNAGPRHRFTVSGKIVSNSYCMSPIGFVRQIKEVTPEQAEGYFNEYNRKFPGVPAFRESFWKFIRMNGCQFDSKFGRTRHVPGIVSNEYQIKKRSERMAIAALIQGTAAEFTKQSLVLMDEYFTEKGMETRISQSIHDEIQTDGPISEFAEVARITKQIMEDFPDFSVPIKVDGSYSTTHWPGKKGIPGLK